MQPRSRVVLGFTLIELLVVVAVIAILAALLMPVVMRGMNSAIGAQCRSRLRQIGAAVQLYKQNYSNVFLRHGQNRWPGDTLWGSGGNRMMPAVLVDAYVAKESEIWVCPADSATINRGAEWWQTSYPASAFVAGLSDTAVRRPSLVITFLDGPFDAGWIEFPETHGPTQKDAPYHNPTRKEYNRHDGRFGALYYDFHVEMRVPGETSVEDFDPS